MSLNLILMGISTGGPKTLRRFIPSLGRVNAAAVLVQHMPKFINNSVCRSLAEASEMDVYLAENGQKLEPGCLYVAPSEIHLKIRQDDTIRLENGPKVCYVCPSADVMMKSVAARRGRLIGVIMTGMGRDGAEGLAHLKSLGAETFAQDEESSVIWGMPGAAAELNAVDHLLPPEKIAQKLRSLVGTLQAVA